MRWPSILRLPAGFVLADVLLMVSSIGSWIRPLTGRLRINGHADLANQTGSLDRQGP
jgi:hypothetical protein